MNLLYMEQARAVRRYHTEGMHEHQRLDAHSWGVAMLVDYLAGDMGVEDRLALMRAALVHDLGEYRTGDIPAPAKRNMGIREVCANFEATVLSLNGIYLPGLTEEQERILSLADAADGALHCIAERRKGNINVVEIYKNFTNYLTHEQDIGRTVAERALFSFILEEWETANGRK